MIDFFIEVLLVVCCVFLEFVNVLMVLVKVLIIGGIGMGKIIVLVVVCDILCCLGFIVLVCLLLDGELLEIVFVIDDV